MGIHWVLTCTCFGYCRFGMYSSSKCIRVCLSSWYIWLQSNATSANLVCAVQLHIKPGQHRMWCKHSSDGWYLRSLPEHYRCHGVFLKATKFMRITDTVFFKLNYITQPSVTKAYVIVKAYQDLARAIQGLHNSHGAEHLEALKWLDLALQPQCEQVIQWQLVALPKVGGNEIFTKNKISSKCYFDVRNH